METENSPAPIRRAVRGPLNRDSLRGGAAPAGGRGAQPAGTPGKWQS